jgi:hypothetical protein
MNKMARMILYPSVLVGLCLAGPAGATWWERIPASVCIASSANSSAVTGVGVDSSSDVYSGGVTVAGGASSKSYSYCPFFESDAEPDSTVTTISVDQYSLSSSIAAGSLKAQACVYSSWAVTCGATTSNAAMTANSHDGMSISDLSAWTDDSGNGYAYVQIVETSGDTSYVAGLYFAGT